MLFDPGLWPQISLPHSKESPLRVTSYTLLRIYLNSNIDVTLLPSCPHAHYSLPLWLMLWKHLILYPSPPTPPCLRWLSPLLSVPQMPQEMCSYGNWLQWKSPVLPGDHWLVLYYACFISAVTNLYLHLPPHIIGYKKSAPNGRCHWWWIAGWLRLPFLDTARMWKTVCHSCVISWWPRTPVWRQTKHRKYNLYAHQCSQIWVSSQRHICRYSSDVQLF